MTILRLYSEDGKYARRPASELFEKRKNWFIGWKCLAGTRGLMIDRDGHVFSATCKSQGLFGRQGSYGNVFNEFQLEKLPLNCARRYCESEFDLSIPKYHRVKYKEVMATESDEVGHVETPVALRGEGTDHKKILWNASFFGFKNLRDWKTAVHRLEGFFKGETGRIILQDPPVQSAEFFEFLRFLTEEKGHVVSVEGSLLLGPAFFQRALTDADLCLRFDGEEDTSFRNLDQIGESFRELEAKRVFRKVIVQLDVKNPEYHRLHSILTGEKYRSWLEPGFFLGKFLIQEPATLPLPEKTPEPPVRKSLSGARVLLFIPMRNCGKTIERLIARLDKTVLDYVDEVLILDNDSTDDSMAVASKAVKSIRDLKVVLRKNEKNYGFGGSHKLAFQYAYLNRMDYVFIVHGDDSGSPQDFLPVLKSGKFREYDLVLSTRLAAASKRESYPLYRFFGNWILNFLAGLVTGTWVKDFTGGPVNLYRVQTFMNKFDNPVKRFSDRISFPQDAFLYVQYKRGLVHYVPITYRESGGKSFYSALTQFARATLLLMSYAVSRKKIFK